MMIISEINVYQQGFSYMPRFYLWKLFENLIALPLFRLSKCPQAILLRE